MSQSPEGSSCVFLNELFTPNWEDWVLGKQSVDSFVVTSLRELWNNFWHCAIFFCGGDIYM